MKTLIVFNHPAPYKVKFFNELAKITDIFVIFERKSAKDRPEKFYSENTFNFPYIFLKHGNFGNENNYSGELKKYIKANYKLFDRIVMNGYSQVAEMRAIRYMIKHKIPYTLMINGGIIKTDNVIKGRLKRYFISHANNYLSPCKFANKYLIHYGANEKNIFLYPYCSYSINQIQTKKLSKKEIKDIRNKYGLPDNSLLIAPNQFIKRKNNIQLISIVSKLKDVSLLLIGDGCEEEQYKQFIENNNIKNVFIRPFVIKEELFKLYQASDAVVSLSKEDIFGHTLIEGMANGIPAIASNNIVSAADYIIDGVNGFLVHLDNEDEIIKAINSIQKINFNACITTAKNNTIETSANAVYETLRK